MKYAKIAMAWAIVKGTVPIIGVTKESHVDNAVSALDVKLDPSEIITLETVAMDTGIVIKASWEKKYEIIYRRDCFITPKPNDNRKNSYVK